MIAEIKFASPSAGKIGSHCNPLLIAGQYERAGASAISVITDKRFFKGDIGYLRSLKGATAVPLLRKDFILDAVQVEESFLYGADAILLIARILSEKALAALIALAKDLGLAALVEVHDRGDLEKALRCGASIIGVNNRDLDSFEVDLNATLEIAPLVPPGCVLVSESGIEGREHIRMLRGTNVRAVLVGTSIMKSRDVEKKTRELVRAGRMTEESGVMSHEQ